GEWTGKLHHRSTEARPRSGTYDARIAIRPLVAIHRIRPRVLRVRQILTRGEARGDGDAIRIGAAKIDADVEYQGVQAGIGEDLVQGLLERGHSFLKTASGRVAGERQDPEVSDVTIELAVLK